MAKRLEWMTTVGVRAIVSVVVFSVGATIWAQMPFFPGAEGFGGTFTGTAPTAGWFSNADVYRVTTTQDYLVNGKGAPGTLRGAFVDFTQPNSPKQKVTNRIVVFDVGGTFELTEGTLDMKEINNIYIAGQTAPSPVTVYGNTSQITKSNNTMTSNVVLRYLSFRKGTGDGADSITFAGGPNNGIGTVATNMIIDHVSASWSEDEVLSVANNNTNVTVQYTMMTDSLTSGHQYGSLMRARVDSQVTFHHNLYGNDKSRNPRMGSYNDKTLTLDFVNNVIYNWSERAGYAGGGSDNATPENVNVNWVGNYAIAGPSTPAGDPSTTAVTKDSAGSNPINLKVYQALNLIDSNHDAVRDGTDTGWGMFKTQTGAPLPDADKVAAPFSVPAVTTTGAADSYDQVIEHVGNWWWDRDVIDERIVGNVKNNTQPAGGIPALLPVASELAYVTAGAYPAAPTTHPAGYDADNDGMKDEWEAKHGGNLVWNADFDGDGYINLIEFINELGEFPAPAPIVFIGGLNNRYAHIMNWKTDDGGITAGSNWQPSKFDEAQINNGTVVVDAVGQHAGVLRLGATAGSNGQLQVSGGWLEVADTIEVGAHETGQGTLVLNGGAVKAEQVAIGFLGQLKGMGTLTADVVNSGAVLPGSSAGTLTIAGDYVQTELGVLSIDLASVASFDKLIVNGDAALGGLLEIMLLGGYSPAEGATFDVLDWNGTKLGAFDALALPTLGDDLEWDTSLLNSQGVLSVVAASSAGLAGDYNNDGVVDTADYTIWRDLLGSNSPLLNETMSLGIVDAEDYDAWKANFGAVLEAGGGAVAGVPEPGSLVLLAVGVCGVVFPRPRREIARVF